MTSTASCFLRVQMCLLTDALWKNTTQHLPPEQQQLNECDKPTHI